MEHGKGSGDGNPQKSDREKPCRDGQINTSCQVSRIATVEQLELNCCEL
jgi:hypothetical protein